MKSLWVALIVLVFAEVYPLASFGQTLPPPPASVPLGPTMEQTVGFIEQGLEKQGNVTYRYADFFNYSYLLQSLKLKSPCTLVAETELTATEKITGGSKSRLLAELDLEQTDPSSVTVKDLEATRPDAYRVIISRTSIKDLPTAGAPLASTATMSIGESADGVVHAILPTSITVLRQSDNTLRLFSFGKKTILWSKEAGSDDHHAISPFDIKVGDQISVTAAKTKDGVTEANLVYDMGPAPPPDTHTFGMFVFRDKDLADRVAKAFVHAIVLCQKDAKPSLF